MTQPTIRVEVDWDGDKVFESSSENIAADVVGLACERGRDFASQLTGRSISGALVVDLLNRTGKYSRFNSASPLFGNILPGRRVQVVVVDPSSSEQTIWSGYLQTIDPQPEQGRVPRATLRAIGPLGFLNQSKARLAMQTNRRTDQSIEDILSRVAWSTSLADLDQGKTTMDRVWLDEQWTIAALREIEVTESGFVSETRDGKVKFDNRLARMTDSRSVNVQATYTDASSAALSYRRIAESDPLPQVFNIFEARVQEYTVAVLAVLWTFSGTAPSIASGGSLELWATYPNPQSANNALAVDAWTTPVASTDYVANAKANGSGVDVTGDVTVAVSKFANAMKMTFTNGGGGTAFLTTLQARGTAVTADDPVLVRRSSTESEGKYGEREFPNPSRFIPDIDEAADWAGYNLSVYKDPHPIVTVRLFGNRDSGHLSEVLVRDVSDRVTLKATNARTGPLGISKDMFVEAVRYQIDSRRNIFAEFDLSDADVTGGFLVWAGSSDAATASNVWAGSSDVAPKWAY